MPDCPRSLSHPLRTVVAMGHHNITLGRDGCVSPPAFEGPTVWPITRHFVTAALRFNAGLDPEPVGLGSQVVGEFSPAPSTYLHRP